MTLQEKRTKDRMTDGKKNAVTSETMTHRAQSIIDSESIIKIDSDTYQVKSTDPAEEEEEHTIRYGECWCEKYMQSETCHHTLAVKMLIKVKEDELVSKVKKYSKEQKLQRAKILLNHLRQRGWGSHEAYAAWSSNVTPWREELAMIGRMMDK